MVFKKGESNIYIKGDKHPRWNGGQTINKRSGHRSILINGKYILEHILVWNKHNGPVPKGYHVHHKDFNPLNNNIENLELLTVSKHRLLHGIKADWKTMKKRHDKGETYASIAREIGCGRRAVKRQLNNLA